MGQAQIFTKRLIGLIIMLTIRGFICWGELKILVVVILYSILTMKIILYKYHQVIIAAFMSNSINIMVLS